MSSRLRTSTRTVAGLCAIAVMGALLVSLAPAEAGTPSTKIKMTGARQEDGPFGPDLRLNLDEDEAKNAHLKVKSISDDDEDADLEIHSLPLNGFSVKFFTKNGTDITDEMLESDGYPFTVKADKPKRFRLRVKQTAADGQTCVRPVAVDDVAGVVVVYVGVNTAASNCLL